MNRLAAALVLVVVGCLASGCIDDRPEVGGSPTPTPTASIPAPPEGLDERASAAWTQWQQLGMDDYAYRLDVSCFCPAVPTADIEVVNDKVVTIDGKKYTGRLIGFTNDLEPTIDGVFTVLGQALGKADKVEVEYDADTGVPTTISIDWYTNAVDDEIGFHASVPVQT